MKWRITLVKDEYVGWNGQKVKARQEVKEFDDIMDAQTWFIHDSYFGQTYTRSASWWAGPPARRWPSSPGRCCCAPSTSHS